MNKHLSYILSILIMVLPATLYAQEGTSETPVKTDLSDPDLIVRPPTDPYSLSFTPPMPEGAENVVDPDGCKAAAGRWTATKIPDLEDEKLVGCLKNNKRIGRWMFMDLKTPVEEQTEDNALGYLWMLDDELHGWNVALDPETRTVIELQHYNKGKKDGTHFSWSKFGSLESVTTYKDDKLDGKYEQYLECLPTVLGQYKDGEPAGIWEIFPEPGLINIRRDFDRPIPIDERPAEMAAAEQAYWTEWFNANGSKVVDGYSVATPPDSNGYRVGMQTFYSVSGQKWIKVSYDGKGRINDQRIFDLCKPANAPDNFIPSYLDYNYDTLTMSCKNAEGETYLSIDFYNTGEVRKKTPMKSDAAFGKVIEYHPTGQILAEYEMKNDVPEGTITFKDIHGNPYGISQITNGTGSFKTWWHDGKPHEEGEYKNGKKTGTWSLWLESGNKVNEAQYDDDGKLNGYRRQWFNNGILSFEQNFAHGINDGRTFYNYADGRLADESIYKDGMPSGVWKDFAHSGNLSYETDYSDFSNIMQSQYYSDGKKRSSGHIIPGFGRGSRTGTWEFYLKNGNKWLSLEYNTNSVMQPDAMQCSQISGAEYSVDEETRELGCLVCSVNRASPLNPVKIREGRWVWYNDNGKIEKSGSIHLGHLNGEWEYYYPNGEKMLIGEYKIDQRVGQWTGYYEDGDKKFSGTYQNGLESGRWETYYPMDGAVSSTGLFTDGRRDGEWQYLYPNGTVREKGSFAKGLETGVWTTYYENGQKQGEGSFIEGKREGTWTWYRENGSVWRTAEYKDGKEIKQ